MEIHHMLTLFLLFEVLLLCTGAHSDEENRSYWGSLLVRHLFDGMNYDKRVRPVRHHSTSINVTLRMNLYLINEVNERAQSLQLYVWTVQMWYDELLAWNPKDFGGVESVVVPHDLVWLPDTYLYNGIEMVRETAERWSSVIISMNPSNVLSLDTANVSDKAFVTFRYPAIYKFTCNMNILYFPFDQHSCTLTFGSWMFDTTGIDYYPMMEDVYMEDYIEHSEWSVISFRAYRDVQSYKCCIHPFSLIHADLVIRRKPLFTIVNLVIPTAIINFISMFGFFSPTTVTGERTEKVSLGITTLLAMSILLLMVSEEMPTTSDFIPLIGWFYLSVIVLIALGTVFSSIIIIVQRQGRQGKRVPKRWRRLLFYTFANKLWLQVPSSILEINHPNAYKCKSNVPLARMEEMVYTDTDLKEFYVKRSNHKCKELETSLRNFRAYPALCNQLREIKMKITFLCDRIQETEQDQKLIMEWEFFALVIDRILLILFNCISLAVTMLIIILGYLGSKSLI
ncbi:Acetylcholine receptor subunit alpha-type deg-3 [Trichinella spiralis]|uniref:Acetylcholine receptor subunit alpha-type deg-3 n=1 Tax=Trichinella spiralis TaxID=6334 RepID=A0A0V1BMF1_TRISP|nr:Acetylcholine receptor subunit alpha-type deg-3 [Trichinella spiralis]